MSYIEQMLKRDRKLMDSGYSLVRGPCYFCGHKHTLLFGEHWTFCPMCSAIYTKMVFERSSCEHINEHSRIVKSKCWYKRDRDAKAYITYSDDLGEKQTCSVCGAECYVDGW